MKPSRYDADFYAARVAEHGAPAWVATLRPKHARSAADCLNAAINARADIKHSTAGASWHNTLALLELVRRNQSHARARGFRLRDPLTGEPELITLAGYMLRTRDSTRRVYFLRLLRRMPADVLEAGRRDGRQA